MTKTGASHTQTPRRKPASFRIEDVEIAEAPEPVALQDDMAPEAEVKDLPKLERGLRWGSIFLGSLGALIGLLVSLWLYDYVLALMAREDWIGWAAVILLALVLVALLMIVLRELAGLIRLGRLGKIRHEADSAARQNDKPLAVDVARRLKKFYAGRKDVSWGIRHLAEHEHDIMDAEELLRLNERMLIAPLDPAARSIVASAAKRVSVVTAISPNALVDMMFVAAQNMRMLRKLATLYGARPGVFSLLKLARMVVTHIVLTGGIALGDDVIQQLVGHGLTARLSRKLGEGVFNGALTTRIGIATIDVCRPLPYLEQKPPRFRELVAEVAGLN